MAHYEDIYLNNNRTYCELCKISVLNLDKCLEDHLNSPSHRELYIKRLLIQNNIKIMNDHVHCLLCDIKMGFGRDLNLSNHLREAGHQNLLKIITEMIKKDGDYLEMPKTLTDGEDVKCWICDRSTEFNLIKVRDHIKSHRHRRARALAVQPFNGIFSVEGDNDFLWCKICHKYFENYVEIIFEHVDEDLHHYKTLNKLMTLIAGKNITIEKYLTEPGQDKAYCNKCGIEIPCNIDNLTTHIKGKKHNS